MSAVYLFYINYVIRNEMAIVYNMIPLFFCLFLRISYIVHMVAFSMKEMKIWVYVYIIVYSPFFLYSKKNSYTDRIHFHWVILYLMFFFKYYKILVCFSLLFVLIGFVILENPEWRIVNNVLDGIFVITMKFRCIEIRQTFAWVDLDTYLTQLKHFDGE